MFGARLRTGCVVAALVAGSGCSGGGSDSNAATSTSQVPAPVALVTYTYVTGAPLVRFAAEISNPGSRPLVGVVTSWTALDAAGVIVGTVEGREEPPIPAGGSVIDTGGAGGLKLSGVPASVRVAVTKRGHFSDKVPEALVSLDGVQFSRAEFDLEPGARDYTVTATLLARDRVTTAGLSINVILKDAGGSVIGADFGDTVDLPSQLAEGDKVVLKVDVSVPHGDPASAVVAVDGQTSSTGVSGSEPTTTVAGTTDSTSTKALGAARATGTTKKAAACHASYSPCLTPGVGDYDCNGGGGDGPNFVTGPVQVHGSDPFGLDTDGDGVGCDGEGATPTAPPTTPPPVTTPPTVKPTVPTTKAPTTTVTFTTTTVEAG